MSNLASDVQQPCEVDDSCSDITKLLHPRERELGGFSVRRLLPTTGQRMVGPWVFFDHMGPADFPAGKGINVRPHPHIGIATVTYLFEGEILHRDSLGSYQPIRPGDINLMVAGRGITHSERERPEVTASAHRQHGLQLWLALPEEDEETEPAFWHYADSSIPAVEIEGVPVRVMMGAAYGVTSPVKTFSETLYMEARLRTGQRLELPATEELAVYVADGSLTAGTTALPSFTMAILSGRDGTVLEGTEDARIAIVGGSPLSPRFMEWNFVSSRRERIEQAKDDWRENRFAKVVGDGEEYIPLPG